MFVFTALDANEAHKEFGTKESPGEVACKLAPEGVTSGKRNILNISLPFFYITRV